MEISRFPKQSKAHGFVIQEDLLTESIRFRSLYGRRIDTTEGFTSNHLLRHYSLFLIPLSIWYPASRISVSVELHKFSMAKSNDEIGNSFPYLGSDFFCISSPLNKKMPLSFPKTYYFVICFLLSNFLQLRASVTHTEEYKESYQGRELSN